MYSKHHAIVSLVVTIGLLAVLDPIVVWGWSLPAVAVVAYGTTAGVLIDLDHFLIARLKTGDWAAVRFCLSNPTAAVADQRQIFEVGDVGVLSRLLSHLVIVGVGGVVLALVSLPLAVVTVVVWYVHIVTDVAWDLSRLERYRDLPKAALFDEFR